MVPSSCQRPVSMCLRNPRRAYLRESTPMELRRQAKKAGQEGRPRSLVVELVVKFDIKSDGGDVGSASLRYREQSVRYLVRVDRASIYKSEF